MSQTPAQNNPAGGPDYAALFDAPADAPAPAPKIAPESAPDTAAARRIIADPDAPTPAPALDLPAADAAPVTAPATVQNAPAADPRRAALQTPATTEPTAPLSPEALAHFAAVIAEKANAPDFVKAATPEARRRLLIYAEERLKTKSSQKSYKNAQLDAAAVSFARKRSPSYAALLDEIEAIIKAERVQSIEDAISRDAEGIAPEKGRIPPNHKTAKLFLSANDPRYKASGETSAPVVNIQLNL